MYYHRIKDSNKKGNKNLTVMSDITEAVKNEPLEQNEQGSENSSFKFEEKTNPECQQYEQIMVKGYTSNFVKEDPVSNISLVFKENKLIYEKEKYHQQILNKISEHMSHINILELENRYIDYIREAAKMEIFNCGSCEYQTMQKSNIRLHLVVIHKTEVETNILKCLKCTYNCKSIKYMQKHVVSHKNEQDSSDDLFSEADFSEDDEDVNVKKVLRSKKQIKRAKVKTQKKFQQCKLIKKIRLNKDLYETHEKNVKVWSCDLCPFETGDKESFVAHKQTHKCPDNMKKFICYKCDYQSTDKVKLKKHLLKLHDIATKNMDSIKILKCEFCEYETDLIRSLEVHALSHKSPDEIQWFQCNICDFKTKFKKSFTEHSIRHKNPEEIVKSFMCEFCSYKCRTKGSLKKHLLTHQPPDENTEWFKCPECDHKTKSKCHLRVHMTIHKDPSEIKMFVCEICGLQSRRKWNYEMHLLTHKNTADVEIFQCTICNYKTKFKDRLKRHLKKGHHGGRGREGKLQKCNICNFECRNRKIYCRHVMSHKTEINQVEGAYVCDVCGFKTMYNSSFSKHKKTHKSMDEVQTFKCPECTYRTKFKGNLKHHINTHKDPTEITMYKCNTCGIQFRRKENLNVHLLLHKSPDEVEMIKCTLCSYQTKFRAYMTTHLKKTHKIVTKKDEYKEYTTIVNPQQNTGVGI